MEVNSRYVVGWTTAPRESFTHPQALIQMTHGRQGTAHNRLVIHSDWCRPITSKAVAQLLAGLGVEKTLLLPCKSNDSLYSEAQFNTMNFRPTNPVRFGSLKGTNAWAGRIVLWCHRGHYYPGLVLILPTVMHFGPAEPIRAVRQHELKEASEQHPERFRNGTPKGGMTSNTFWIKKNHGFQMTTDSKRADRVWALDSSVRSKETCLAQTKLLFSQMTRTATKTLAHTTLWLLLLFVGACSKSGGPTRSVTAEGLILPIEGQKREGRAWHAKSFQLLHELPRDLDGLLYDPGYFVVDRSQHVYVVDYGDYQIKRFDPDGTFVTSYGNGFGAGPGEFLSVSDVRVLGDSMIYVTDPDGSRVSLLALPLF